MIRKTTAGDASELAWFKSSYSGGNDGNSCVELALTPGTVHVRDSKKHRRPPVGARAHRMGGLRGVRLGTLTQQRHAPRTWLSLDAGRVGV